MATAPKKTSDATVTALKREVEPAEDETPVTFCGETYTLPGTPEDWDIVVLESFENDHVVSGVKLLLGEEQWARFSRKHKKVRDVNAFMEQVFEVLGTDSGK